LFVQSLKRLDCFDCRTHCGSVSCLECRHWARHVARIKVWRGWTRSNWGESPKPRLAAGFSGRYGQQSGTKAALVQRRFSCRLGDRLFGESPGVCRSNMQYVEERGGRGALCHGMIKRERYAPRSLIIFRRVIAAALKRPVIPTIIHLRWVRKKRRQPSTAMSIVQRRSQTRTSC